MADNTRLLKTPPGSSEYKIYRDEKSNPPALFYIVGMTRLSYHLLCVEYLHLMLEKHGDWKLLGSTDEQIQTAEGMVEV